MATALPADLPGLLCPHCAYLMERRVLISGRQTCDRCERFFEVMLFTPVERRLRIADPVEAAPGVPACAQHRGNVSTGHCARCGVFLCPVCRIEIDRRAYCPACFERLLSEGGLDTALRTYRDYGSLGSLFAVLGLITWIFGLALGPAAIYYCLKGLGQREDLGQTGGQGVLWAWLFLGVFDFLAGAGFLFALLR